MGEEPKQLDPDEIDYNDPPFPLTAIDRELLATKDEDYCRITWEDLKKFIDLRRYLAWSHNIKKQYGSITNFVIKERLHWTPSSPDRPHQFKFLSSTPFAERSDFAVLMNDWPYGFVPGIAHIIVWSKTPIATDDTRGDVLPESRTLIESFVTDYFINKLGPDGKDRVLWFKNWVSLQSVRGVDHVHILVRDAPEELLRRWTDERVNLN